MIQSSTTGFVEMSESIDTLRFNPQLLESDITDNTFIVLVQAMVGIFDNCWALANVLEFISQVHNIKNPYFENEFALILMPLTKQQLAGLSQTYRTGFFEKQLKSLFNHCQNFELTTKGKHEILEKLYYNLVSPPDDYFRPYHNPPLWKKRMAQLYEILTAHFNGVDEIKLISKQYGSVPLNTVVHPEYVSFFKKLFVELLTMIDFDTGNSNSFSTVQIHSFDKIYAVGKGAGEIHYNKSGWQSGYFGKICYKWDKDNFVFNYWHASNL